MVTSSADELAVIFDFADWDFAGRIEVARSSRLGTLVTPVVGLDHLVAGLAGGDHKTAARAELQSGSELRDSIEMGERSYVTASSPGGEWK